MGSLKRHEGYIRIDHHASPGTPEVPEGTIYEAAAITCCHCNAVFVPTKDAPVPRGYCAKCDHWTCPKPVCTTECHPIKASVDLAQRHADVDEPFLLRGPRGEILHDPRYLDETRIY